MVCKNKWAALAQELEKLTQLAPASVNGAARCIRCDRPLMKDGRCVMGHSQGAAAPAQPAGFTLGEDLADALLCVVDELYAEGLDLEADPRIIYARYALAESRRGLPGFTGAGEEGWVHKEWDEHGHESNFGVRWGASLAAVQVEYGLGPEETGRNKFIPLAAYVQQEVPPALRGQPGDEMRVAVQGLYTVLQDQRQVLARWGDQWNLEVDPRLMAAARYTELTTGEEERRWREMSYEDRIAALLAPFGRPDSIRDFAAQAAAKELVENWSQAIGDGGYTLPQLLAADVPEVMRQLRDWHTLLAAGRSATVPEGGIGDGSDTPPLRGPEAAEAEALRQQVAALQRLLEAEQAREAEYIYKLTWYGLVTDQEPPPQPSDEEREQLLQAFLSGGEPPERTPPTLPVEPPLAPLLEKPLTRADLQARLAAGETAITVTVPMSLGDYADVLKLREDIGDDLLLDTLRDRVVTEDVGLDLGSLEYEEAGFRRNVNTPPGPQLLIEVTIDLTGFAEEEEAEDTA